jgi:hypothetical protein
MHPGAISPDAGASIDSHEHVGFRRTREPGCSAVCLPEWRTANSVMPGTAMIDRLVIGWSDEWRCGDQRSVALLMAGLLHGRNLTGERVTRGFYWKRAGELRLSLRCNGRAADFITATVATDRYTSPSGTLRLHGELHINPIRFQRHLGDQSLDQWFANCRSIDARRQPETHDNVLPIDPAGPALPDYYWCDMGADIVDRFIGLVMAALYGERSRRPLATWVKQAECCWEFASPTPIRAVDEITPAIRACAGANEARYEVSDDLGLPVLSLSLGAENHGPRLVIYPRDSRIRLEVRYLANLGRYAPGAGNGSLCRRFRSIADASVRHVNRALHATRNYRQPSVIFGFGSLVEFLQRIILVLGGRSDWITRFADELLRNRYVRAGSGGACVITLNEAERLQRAGILARRTVRSRDRNGRIYALDSYFERLPWGV